jgi:hypothetical protein
MGIYTPKGTLFATGLNRWGQEYSHSLLYCIEENGFKRRSHSKN